MNTEDEFLNKTKQEMLALIEELDDEFVTIGVSDEAGKLLRELRTLITDSVILSDGEIEGMRTPDESYPIKCEIEKQQRSFRAGRNAALDKIKEMK